MAVAEIGEGMHKTEDGNPEQLECKLEKLLISGSFTGVGGSARGGTVAFRTVGLT